MRVLDRRRSERPRPSTPRAPITETSRSKSTNASSIASWRADRGPGRAASVGRGDRDLALAVVAEARGLEHRRHAEPRDGAARVVAAVRTARERRHRKAARRRESLFSRSRCCVMCSDVPARAHGRRARRRPRPRPPARSRTRRSRRPRCARTRARRRDRRRTRRPRASATWPVGVSRRARACGRGSPSGARPGEHAAELAAAEHADGRARRRIGRRSRQRVLRGPRCVCSARNARKLLAQRGPSCVARIATASSAALVGAGLADGQRADRHPARASARSRAASPRP